MSDVTIAELPDAGVVSGTDLIPVFRDGQTYAATASAVQSSTLTPSYVVLGSDGSLLNERVLTAGTGIAVTDGGPGSNVTVGITNNATLPGSAGITIPRGTTAERPAAGVNGTYLRFNTDTLSYEFYSGGVWNTIPSSGTPAVTSVGLSLPTEFSVSGSPVTSSGTLSGVWASATQNYVFAAPNGSSGTPSFRALVANDTPGNLPSWSTKTLPTGAVVGDTDTQTLTNKTLTLPVTNGIDFSATPAAGQPRRLTWNVDDGTLDLGMNNGAVTQQIGLETYTRVKADSPIANGQAVMVTGAVGLSGRVTAAPANAVTIPEKIIGLATEDFLANDFGFVTNFGTVRGIQTNGANYGETWTEGDIIYASNASGGLTKVRPTTGLAVHIGVVTTAHASNGAIQVNVAVDGTRSVGLSLPAEFTVTNSPVTDTGTLTGAWATQTANKVFASATSGGAATPSFRALVANDTPGNLPSWSTKALPTGVVVGDTDTQTLTNKTLSGATLSGTTALPNGGSISSGGALLLGSDVRVPSGGSVYSQAGVLNIQGYTGINFQVTGANTRASIDSSGNISLGASGAETLKLTASGSGDYFQMANATGSAYFYAAGSSANVNMTHIAKGSGAHQFYTGTYGSGVLQVQIPHTASAVNYISATGSATGNGVTISAAGSDSNIDINLTPKGTGVVKLNVGAAAIGTSTTATVLTATHDAGSGSADILLVRAAQTATSAQKAIHYVSDYDGTPDTEFYVRGDGWVFGDGASYQTPADYAEMFPWLDGNPDGEERVGLSVVLDGRTVRPATGADDPTLIIGVVSGNPAVLGDAADLRWSEKYLKDEWNRYQLEPVEYVSWDETIPAAMRSEQRPVLLDDASIVVEMVEVVESEASTIHHSYPVDAVPAGLTVPTTATREVHQRRVLNPDYDPSLSYTPRRDRAEWDAIGLVGKLRLRKGQPVGARWIKMRDISANVEEWLVR